MKIFFGDLRRIGITSITIGVIIKFVALILGLASVGMGIGGPIMNIIADVFIFVGGLICYFWCGEHPDMKNVYGTILFALLVSVFDVIVLAAGINLPVYVALVISFLGTAFELFCFTDASLYVANCTSGSFIKFFTIMILGLVVVALISFLIFYMGAINGGSVGVINAFRVIYYVASLLITGFTTINLVILNLAA